MNRADKNWVQVKKVHTKKSKFSKNFINTNWSPNQVFFIEFFFGKIRPILDPEN